MTKLSVVFCLLLVMVPLSMMLGGCGPTGFCYCRGDPSFCPSEYHKFDYETCRKECHNCFWETIGENDNDDFQMSGSAKCMILIFGFLGCFCCTAVCFFGCCPETAESTSASSRPSGGYKSKNKENSSAPSSGYSPLLADGGQPSKYAKAPEWQRNKWEDEDWVREKKRQGWDDDRINERLHGKQEFREDQKDLQKYLANPDNSNSKYASRPQWQRDKWEDEDFARAKKREGWDDQRIADYVETRQERREDRTDGIWRADDYYAGKGKGKGW